MKCIHYYHWLLVTGWEKVAGHCMLLALRLPFDYKQSAFKIRAELSIKVDNGFTNDSRTDCPD